VKPPKNSGRPERMCAFCGLKYKNWHVCQKLEDFISPPPPSYEDPSEYYQEMIKMEPEK